MWCSRCRSRDIDVTLDDGHVLWCICTSCGYSFGRRIFPDDGSLDDGYLCCIRDVRQADREPHSPQAGTTWESPLTEVIERAVYARKYEGNELNEREEPA